MLDRMRLPKRYWNVELARIHESSRVLVSRYVVGLGEAMSKGIGMVLWGLNETGKTAAACVVAKEARRRGYSVLFLMVNEYLEALMRGTMFNLDTSVVVRAREVDLLVFDDLGKDSFNANSATSHQERVIEDLLRHRYDGLRSTIITTNMAPKDIESRFGKSFVSILRSTAPSVEVVGDSHRMVEAKQLLRIFGQEDCNAERRG